MTLNVDHERPRSARDAVLRCEDCGLVLRPGAVLHDQALMLASICPRCDGALSVMTATPDPSIYLG
ncbi:MAG: hypothetical protein ACRDLP_04500 [Solirubrobacteraceae bacterium]